MSFIPPAAAFPYPSFQLPTGNHTSLANLGDDLLLKPSDLKSFDERKGGKKFKTLFVNIRKRKTYIKIYLKK